jgi:hypothetical protein
VFNFTLFNDAVSSRDLEANGHYLLEGTDPEFTWRDWQITIKLKQNVSNSSKIQTRNLDYTNLSVEGFAPKLFHDDLPSGVAV